mmetsp:Transcript_18035/g.27032  ORF Transcript_18035/g.27032 Transcript_18035/m.27032 type:complete len:431 (-) Transcript_18035:59-1351(-)|eukprot:CAMPEP_0167753192 /NCGR_PEP_ID=MMETSP0110_2-20121227/7568_1 /TAXON_ID=629695 /ORGANISM="Gymnochlora sp., Strain CCMP2014" /LENGTH=430 /DNA_ID=CAMNT_0007638913 /DNA_START=53 /DNA_END=1345 /DNA_ORIENTATION=-
MAESNDFLEELSDDMSEVYNEGCCAGTINCCDKMINTRLDQYDDFVEWLHDHGCTFCAKTEPSTLAMQIFSTFLILIGGSIILSGRGLFSVIQGVCGLLLGVEGFVAFTTANLSSIRYFSVALAFFALGTAVIGTINLLTVDEYCSSPETNDREACKEQAQIDAYAVLLGGSFSLLIFVLTTRRWLQAHAYGLRSFRVSDNTDEKDSFAGKYDDSKVSLRRSKSLGKREEKRRSRGWRAARARTGRASRMSHKEQKSNPSNVYAENITSMPTLSPRFATRQIVATSNPVIQTRSKPLIKIDRISQPTTKKDMKEKRNAHDSMESKVFTTRPRERYDSANPPRVPANTRDGSPAPDHKHEMSPLHPRLIRGRSLGSIKERARTESTTRDTFPRGSISDIAHRPKLTRLDSVIAVNMTEAIDAEIGEILQDK